MRRHHWTRFSLGRKLKFNQLIAFDRVLETGSLLRAASELGLTQPALTKIIHELESSFEGPLLERSNRGVKPTDQGVLLGRRVKALMAELRYLTDEMNAFVDGSGGRVIVGTMMVAAAQVLPRAIVRLKQRVPNVLITVHESNTAQLYPALATGDLDVVVGRVPEPGAQAGGSALEHHVLFAESLCVVGGARHWSHRTQPMALRDLMGEAWILPPPESPVRAAAETLFHTADLEWPADVVESLSILTSLGMMLETPRISLMPRKAAQQFLDTGTLSVLDVAESVAFGEVGYSVRVGHPLSAACLQFIECLREAAREAAEESPKR